MSEKMVDRRKFIKTMALAGVSLAGAGALAGCSNGAAAGTADPKAAGPEWKEETDIIVIGSGFAGMAAALEALEAGSKVIMIEKMPVIGGNSTINGGDVAACGSKMQVEGGFKDSPELMAKDMMKAGLNYNHLDRVQLLAEKSNEALEWSMNYLGVKYTKVNFHGGHSVSRTHMTENATGADIIKAAAAKLKEKGVTPATNTKLVRLIENDEKRIIGVEVLEGYKFGKEDSGTPKLIKAKKAVIMASGGFAQDIKMRQIHEPRLTDKFTSTNHLGATGEALREVLKHGAMDVHMDWIQLGPWTSPDEPGFGYTAQFCERLVGMSPMINVLTGKRFIMETGNRKVRADAIIELGEPCIIFGDEYAVKRQVVPKILEGGMGNGAFKKFDTLEEIAAAYKIPVEPFLAEVKHWNSMVLNGKDEDFGTMLLEGAKPTEQGPFYVARLWPKVHHCMGGLYTNLKGQVINQDFETIKGLYAAGEITGGTHGAVRLGGVACTDCLVYGRIAGQEAAKEAAWS
ncbi:MAG: flavocytochrome c [Desulfitobacterium sp.]